MSRGLVILLAMLAASPAAASGLAANYDVWRGPSFNRLAAITETGRIEDGGESGPAAFAQNVAGNNRATLAIGPLATAYAGVSGSGGYTDYSGQYLPFSPAELGYLRDDARLLLAGALDHASTQPNEAFHGRPVAVLRVAGRFGASYDYLLDAKTGALVAIRTKRDGTTELTRYGDWRMVNGVRLPFTIAATGDAGLGMTADDTTVTTFTRVIVNPPAQRFALPADHQLLAFKTATGTNWLPITLDDNLIHLAITVNGQKVGAIMDSGAQLSVLDTHYAAGMGIRSAGTFITLGQGGSAAIGYAPGATLAVPGLTLRPVTLGLIDLQFPGVKQTPPLVAILGGEVFAQGVVDIDYPHQRLAFRPPGTPPPAGAITVPLGTDAGSFVVPVSVENAPPIPVLLDTGDDGTFQLFPAFWRLHPSLTARPASDAEGGGVGGMLTYRVITLATIGLGKALLHDVPTALEPPGIDTTATTDIIGNIGGATLRRCRVIVDFPDRRISFIPAPGAATPFPHDLLGLETEPAAGTTLRVFFVQPNSPAARAGIRAGAILATIDARPAAGLDEDWQTQLRGHVTLGFADHTSKTVTPASYY